MQNLIFNTPDIGHNYSNKHKAQHVIAVKRIIILAILVESILEIELT